MFVSNFVVRHMVLTESKRLTCWTVPMCPFLLYKLWANATLIVQTIIHMIIMLIIFLLLFLLLSWFFAFLLSFALLYRTFVLIFSFLRLFLFEFQQFFSGKQFILFRYGLLPFLFYKACSVESVACTSLRSLLEAKARLISLSKGGLPSRTQGSCFHWGAISPFFQTPI